MEGFFHQWNKYCGLPGMVVCEHEIPEIPDGWSFVRAGFQTDAKNWAGNLLVALDQFYDDTVLLLLEDYWVTYVNTERLKELNSWFGHDPSLSKIDLTNDRLGFAHTEYQDGYVRSTQDAEYLTSVQAAIWRTSFLRECLSNPGWNPWQFEVEGSQRAKLLKHKVLGCRVPVLINANIVLKGKISESDVAKLPIEDRLAIDGIGINDG
jgi:hypothetical protein